MRVLITASKPDLDSDVDPRFGRCRYLLIVDIDTLDFEALENPNISAASGAGIQSAELAAGKRAEAVLTGNCGPNAFRTLKAAGIRVVTGVTGPIREALKDFEAGRFAVAHEANVSGHSGMSAFCGRDDKEEIMPGRNGAGSGRQGDGSPRGKGRGGGRGFALGPGGNCVCPGCGKTVPHQQGAPCYEMKCPSCGAPMTRERN